MNQLVWFDFENQMLQIPEENIEKSRHSRELKVPIPKTWNF